MSATAICHEKRQRGEDQGRGRERGRTPSQQIQHAVLRDRDVLQEAQLVEHLARAHDDGRERIFGRHDRKTGFLSQEDVEVPEQRAATGEDDALVDDVGSELRRAALEAYPDAVFVEDTALCLREVAVLMRSGAQSRAGEVGQIAPVLRGLYDQVLEISGSGFIEGGDILTAEREILIGLSARTNQAGVDECAQLVAPWGYRVRCIEIPKDVLHFKTDCSLLDGETILTTPRLAASGCFENYRVINTGEGEEAAANAIRFNEVLIMAAGFPKTAAALETAGFNVKQVENSECAKLDGGMSCLSLRFSPKSDTAD